MKKKKVVKYFVQKNANLTFASNVAFSASNLMGILQHCIQLASLRKSRSSFVCVCVHVCVCERERERVSECVCGGEGEDACMLIV